MAEIPPAERGKPWGTLAGVTSYAWLPQVATLRPGVVGARVVQTTTTWAEDGGVGAGVSVGYRRKVGADPGAGGEGGVGHISVTQARILDFFSF